jgi:hypothetical protein
MSLALRWWLKNLKKVQTQPGRLFHGFCDHMSQHRTIKSALPRLDRIPQRRGMKVSPGYFLGGGFEG